MSLQSARTGLSCLRHTNTCRWRPGLVRFANGSGNVGDHHRIRLCTAGWCHAHAINRSKGKRMQTKLRVRQALTAVAALGFATTLSVVVRGDGLKGAIFTTNMDGTIVNQNQYAAKTDVYLDGGPGPHAPLTAASLPDGIYVFQVTDPSGKALLSTDAASNRQFTVLGGQITAVHTHNTGTDTNDGGLTVQLYPFLDTPNPGGVYKAWVTPLDVYLGRVGNAGLIAVPVAATCIAKNGSTSKCTGGTTPTTYVSDPGFGPPRNQQKTDNFKIKDLHPPKVHVQKYEDTNGNGVYDEGDEEIGVRVCIDLNGHKTVC